MKTIPLLLYGTLLTSSSLWADTFRSNYRDNLCLSVNSDSAADWRFGVNVEVAACNASAIYQNFELKAPASTQAGYTIEVLGKCVDIDQVSIEDWKRGSNVQLATCSGAVSQQFDPIEKDATLFSLRSRFDGRCLDIDLNNGDGWRFETNVSLWKCHEEPNQLWSLQATDEVDKNPPAKESTLNEQGGNIAIAGVATIRVPAGAFDQSTVVRLGRSDHQQSQSLLTVAKVFYGAEPVAMNGIELRLGKSLPLKPVAFDVSLTPEFAGTLEADDEVVVLARVREASALDAYDSFEPVTSSYDKSRNLVTVTLDPQQFTYDLADPSTVMAELSLIKISRTPLRSAPLILQAWGQRSKLRADATQCEASSLSNPLAEVVVLSPFSPEHSGVDLQAAEGTPVFPLAGGTVAWVGFDERTLPAPQPQTGIPRIGLGNFVIITHADGSHSLYANLQNGIQVKVGDSVTTGQTIALSGNTGGSSTPHLHIQFAPGSAIYQKIFNIDPIPCLGKFTNSSISLKDNGAAADDAFSLALDGVTLGETAVGAANAFGIGNLRWGIHNLRITSTVAPDDTGTFEVTLQAPLQFADGSRLFSATLKPGESVEVQLTVVPTQQ